jgi:hypothetical protein
MKEATGNGTIDAVLPLLARDHGRFAILRQSLNRFWQGGIIHVIVRAEDMGRTRDLIGEDQRFHIVNQESLMGSITGDPPGVGWWTQQILKLAASQIVGSDFYLTLDADCLLVRNVSREALVRNERGRVGYHSHNRHLNWYHASSRMLGLPKTIPMRSVSVTPFLLHTKTTAALAEHTATLAHERKVTSWQKMLLNRLGWTEYTLYHLFSLAKGLWDAHHELESSRLIGPSVWFKRDAETWNPSEAFEGERKFFFIVIQSNTHIEADWTRARVTPYLL